MKNLYFLIGLLVLFPVFAQAQTYTQSGNPTNVPGTTCWCMTNQPALNATSVWENNNFTLADFQNGSTDLTWNLEINLGDNDLGGHGLAFVIQNEGAFAGGNAGAPLGYGGISKITPSLAIEIDTYDNSYDPTVQDHMAVHLNGDHKTMASGGTHTVLPNMEDGGYHSFDVVWHYDAATPSNSSITATIDGTYVISYNIDMASLFNATDIIYIGFTGGVNATAQNDQKVSFKAPGTTGSCSESLPVEFMGFDATSLGDRKVELEWATASELNNDYFEVMRSADGINWSSVRSMDGAGSTDEIHMYGVQDHVPFQGKVFYQLKQVDYNGDFSFSDVLQIDIGFDDPLDLVAYPNPVSDLLNLNITTEEIQQALKLELVHITGKRVHTQLLSPIVSHQQQIELPVGKYAPGVYFVRLSTESIQTTQRVIITR